MRVLRRINWWRETGKWPVLCVNTNCLTVIQAGTHCLRHAVKNLAAGQEAVYVKRQTSFGTETPTGDIRSTTEERPDDADHGTKVGDFLPPIRRRGRTRLQAREGRIYAGDTRLLEKADTLLGRAGKIDNIMAVLGDDLTPENVLIIKALLRPHTGEAPGLDIHDPTAQTFTWHDEDDVPLALRGHLLQAAQHLGCSYYWLTAIYRRGRTDAIAEPKG